MQVKTSYETLFDSVYDHNNLVLVMETNRDDAREVWQRGPVKDVPPLLQPVAHALLQVGEELERYMRDFPAELLWVRPAGLASVGFHLLHISGVIDRLFTYARGEALSQDQLKYLASEKESSDRTAPELLEVVQKRINEAVEQLEHTLETSLTESRELGRKKIPTTVIGLMFHAAEHAQRHTGQLLVTSRIVQEGLRHDV